MAAISGRVLPVTAAVRLRAVALHTLHSHEPRTHRETGRRIAGGPRARDRATGTGWGGEGTRPVIWAAPSMRNLDSRAEHARSRGAPRSVENRRKRFRAHGPQPSTGNGGDSKGGRDAPPPDGCGAREYSPLPNPLTDAIDASGKGWVHARWKPCHVVSPHPRVRMDAREILPPALLSPLTGAIDAPGKGTVICAAACPCRNRQFHVSLGEPVLPPIECQYATARVRGGLSRPLRSRVTGVMDAQSVRRDYRGVGTPARDVRESLSAPGPLLCPAGRTLLAAYGLTSRATGTRDIAARFAPPMLYRSRVVSTDGQREFGEQRSRERPTSFNRGVSVLPITCGNLRKGNAGMTVRLANGGTVTVRENGTVEYRENGRVMRMRGRGDYASTARWVESLAFGRDVRYVTR